MSDRDKSKDYRVRNDELRELVEQWRGQIEMTGFDRQIAAKNQTLSDCADELEALIEGS